MDKADLLIVGLGEALFDLLPQGEKLGGAPLNVAIHADRLGKPFGVSGAVASRVGSDDRGHQVRDLLQTFGLKHSVLQIDPDLPTGVVTVEIDQGSPSYTIEEGAAWDQLSWGPELENLANNADAVCFGSLAQRSPQARKAIRRFLEHSPQAIRLFDINLRQPYIDLRVLEESCELASAVKCNDEELSTLLTATHLIESADQTCDADRWIPVLLDQYSLDFFLLTQGKKGCRLFTSEGSFEAEVPRFPADPSADTVGAGDSTSAATLIGFLLKWQPPLIVKTANAMGAYIASQSGATPELPPEFLHKIQSDARNP